MEQRLVLVVHESMKVLIGLAANSHSSVRIYEIANRFTSQLVLVDFIESINLLIGLAVNSYSSSMNQ